MKKQVGVIAIVLIVAISSVAVAQETIFSTEGTFGPGDDRGSDGAFNDTYRIAVDADSTIEVVCRSDQIDTYIEAVFPDGSRIENDDYDGFNAGFVRTVTATGTLQITVSPLFSGEEGPYELVVIDLGEGSDISVGDEVRGALGGKSGNRGSQRYRLEGRAGQRVVIDLESDDFDSYLTLTDESGATFTDDDGGELFNSRLGYQFTEDGAVTIIASSLSGDGNGDFVLRVAEASDTVVAEYRGVLESSDLRAYDGTFYDVYEYDGTGGDSISVFVQSAAFDTYVYVSAPDGRNIGSDDDGGGGTDSYVNTTLPETGTYSIFVVSLFEGTGPYVLQILE